MSYNIIYINKTSQISGAEMNLFYTLKGLSADRFKFQVILPSKGPFEEKLKKCEMPAKLIRRRKIRKSLNPLYNFLLLMSILSFTSKLIRIIKKEKIHLVYANSLYDCIYAGLAAKLTHTPFLCQIRDILPSNWKRTIWVKLISLSADKIITDSNAVKEMFAQSPRGFNKAETIYTGVDTDAFYPENRADEIRQEFGLHHNESLLVNIGALIHWKGQESFLKAAHLILKELPQTRFMIVGTPFSGAEDYEKYLKKRTRDLGLESHVIFTGFREDIPQILKAADLYVHCAALPDPFPRALLEAMASAKPVVAPRCGGIPELIQDNINGILFPARDIELMARAIISLLKNSDLRQKLGSAAKRHVEKEFTLEKHIRKMERVYRQLIEGKNH